MNEIALIVGWCTIGFGAIWAFTKLPEGLQEAIKIIVVLLLIALIVLAMFGLVGTDRDVWPY